PLLLGVRPGPQPDGLPPGGGGARRGAVAGGRCAGAGAAGLDDEHRDRSGCGGPRVHDHSGRERDAHRHPDHGRRGSGAAGRDAPRADRPALRRSLAGVQLVDGGGVGPSGSPVALPSSAPPSSCSKLARYCSTSAAIASAVGTSAPAPEVIIRSKRASRPLTVSCSAGWASIWAETASRTGPACASRESIGSCGPRSSVIAPRRAIAASG